MSKVFYKYDYGAPISAFVWVGSFNKFDQGVHVQSIFKLKVLKPNIIPKIVLDEVFPFHTLCNVSGICHSFVLSVL